MKIIVVNRRARFEYELLERLVAGLALTGSEVKSVRAGKVSLVEGHVAFEHGDAYLVNVNIATYDNAGYNNHDPLRRRKLLLHERELKRLFAKVTEKGLTVVPLAIGIEGNWIKLEIALAKGKKLHDKRDAMRQRTLDREAAADMKAKRSV